MIEHYKKPSVKFIVNKGNFNKLMALLAFQEENIVTEEWKEKAKNLQDLLLRYSVPKKDEDGENSEEQEHLKRIKQELLESLKRVKLLENNIYGSTKENKEKEIKMNEKYKQQVIQSEKIKEEKSTKEIEQERE